VPSVTYIINGCDIAPLDKINIIIYNILLLRIYDVGKQYYIPPHRVVIQIKLACGIYDQRYLLKLKLNFIDNYS